MSKNTMKSSTRPVSIVKPEYEKSMSALKNVVKSAITGELLDNMRAKNEDLLNELNQAYLNEEAYKLEKAENPLAALAALHTVPAMGSKGVYQTKTNVYYFCKYLAEQGNENASKAVELIKELAKDIEGVYALITETTCPCKKIHPTMHSLVKLFDEKFNSNGTHERVMCWACFNMSKKQLGKYTHVSPEKVGAILSDVLYTMAKGASYGIETYEDVKAKKIGE